MIEQIVLYLISYLIFVFLESLAINGVYEAFKGSCYEDLKKGRVCSGNIFYKINPEFFERHKGKNWTLPLWGCVKCQSSVIGGVMFWGAIIPIFGFHWVEFPMYVFNTFILVPLNWILYKKL